MTLPLTATEVIEPREHPLAGVPGIHVSVPRPKSGPYEPTGQYTNPSTRTRLPLSEVHEWTLLTNRYPIKVG